MKKVTFLLLLIAGTSLSSFLWFLQFKEKFLDLTYVESVNDVYGASVVWATVISAILFYPLYKLYRYLETTKNKRIIRITAVVVYFLVIGLFARTFFYLSQIA